jgi:hypothetical protein
VNQSIDPVVSSDCAPGHTIAYILVNHGSNTEVLKYDNYGEAAIVAMSLGGFEPLAS